MNERLKALISEYGPVAFAIHFSLFFCSVAFFWVALGMGFEFGGESDLAPDWLAKSGSAKLVGAYIASQVIKPFRLAATVFLTPAVAKLFRSYRSPLSETVSEPADSLKERSQ